jgi:hypothetical protein
MNVFLRPYSTLDRVAQAVLLVAVTCGFAGMTYADPAVWIPAATVAPRVSMSPGESSSESGTTLPGESAAPSSPATSPAIAATQPSTDATGLTGADTQPSAAAATQPSAVANGLTGTDPQPLAAAATQPTADVSAPPAAGTSDADSLRQLIGVSPNGLQPVDLPKLPAMSLRGFINPQDGPPRALLQIDQINQTFLVEVGTEIPVTMQGRVSSRASQELVGLPNSGGAPPPPPQNTDTQSQIILKVVHISAEGVTVRAGLIDQTIVIR